MVLGHGQTLDVAAVRHGHRDVLFVDEVGDVDLGVIVAELRPSGRGITLLYLGEFLHDDLFHRVFRTENALELPDLRALLFELFVDFLHLEPRKALQTHFEDGHGLFLAEEETLRQLVYGVLSVRALFEQFHHFVDVGERDGKTVEDVLSLLRLFEVELRAADDDVLLVRDVIFEDLLEIEYARHAVHEREQNDGVVHLQTGLLEQRVEHDLRIVILLDVDDYAHARAVGLLADVRDAFEPLVLDLVGDVLDELRLVDLIGDLCDDDAALAVRELLYLRARANDRRPSARAVRLAYCGAPQHESRRGIVGRGDVLHEVVHFEFGIAHERDDRVYYFAEVVGRNGRRHTHRYAVRTVDEKVGKARGKHDGLFARVVEVGIEVHRALVNVADHLQRDPGKTRFGVTVRRGGIAVHGAEVAVPVHEGTADGEILRETDHCVVDGDVAVGVVFAQHFADHHSALAVRLVGSEPQLAHGVKYAPVHGLQSVPDVGNGAGHVDRHGVGDE